MTGAPFTQLALAVTVRVCASAVPARTPWRPIAKAATRRSRTVRLYIVFLPHIFPSLHTSTSTDCVNAFSEVPPTARWSDSIAAAGQTGAGIHHPQRFLRDSCVLRSSLAVVGCEETAAQELDFCAHDKYL